MTPTRDSGLERLRGFLPRAGRDYARLRNHDLGPGRHRHVAVLSPWIRHRLVTEQEVVEAVLERHGFSAADKFIQEVFWRTYWKGWLELRPGVWRSYRDEVARLAGGLERDAGLHERWLAATAGRTGIDCFDAWADELTETGYLHNHARMWFASIWIFTLQLPWALGADFFLRHLLDGDPASNTLSWRWVAGLQTRGKTYLARADNIARYTEGRFPQVHGLARSAPPLDGPPPPAPLAPPSLSPWDPELPAGLLLTEEDLSPEQLLATTSRIRALCAVRTTGRRSPFEPVPRVTDFVAGAFADTERRLADQAAPELERVDEAAEPVAQIIDWARRNKLRQVLTPYIPVGPTADALDGLAGALAAQDIAFVPLLRSWDRLSWPHATRGFFPFREKIPGILGALSLDEAPAA